MPHSIFVTSNSTSIYNIKSTPLNQQNNFEHRTDVAVIPCLNIVAFVTKSHTKIMLAGVIINLKNNTINVITIISK